MVEQGVPLSESPVAARRGPREAASRRGARSRSSCSSAASAWPSGSSCPRSAASAAAARRRRSPRLRLLRPSSRSSSRKASRGPDGRAHQGGEPDRSEQAQDQPAALVEGLPRRDGELEDPGDVREGREAAESRGLPLPVDVRVRAADDLAAARQPAAPGVRGELGEGRSRVREVEEPDAVRRADHRVARSRRRSSRRRSARSSRR